LSHGIFSLRHLSEKLDGAASNTARQVTGRSQKQTILLAPVPVARRRHGACISLVQLLAVAASASFTACCAVFEFARPGLPGIPTEINPAGYIFSIGMPDFSACFVL
jgi:hypothetical protein